MVKTNGLCVVIRICNLKSQTCIADEPEGAVRQFRGGKGRGEGEESKKQMIPEELRPHSGMTTMATRQGSSSRKGRLVMKHVMLWVKSDTSHALCSWMNTCKTIDRK